MWLINAVYFLFCPKYVNLFFRVFQSLLFSAFCLHLVPHHFSFVYFTFLFMFLKCVLLLLINSAFESLNKSLVGMWYFILIFKSSCHEAPYTTTATKRILEFFFYHHPQGSWFILCQRAYNTICSEVQFRSSKVNFWPIGKKRKMVIR